MKSEVKLISCFIYFFHSMFSKGWSEHHSDQEETFSIMVNSHNWYAEAKVKSKEDIKNKGKKRDFICTAREMLSK